MRKSTGSIQLVILASLVSTGCDMDPNVQAQRDVYTKMEDCVADWGDPKLCQTMAQEASQQQAQQATQAGGGHAVFVPHYFGGPMYYGGNRAYIDPSSDRVVTPRTNRASSFRSTSIRSSSLPSRVAARGGFGGAGRSVGFSGS